MQSHALSQKVLSLSSSQQESLFEAPIIDLSSTNHLIFESRLKDEGNLPRETLE